MKGFTIILVFCFISLLSMGQNNFHKIYEAPCIYMQNTLLDSSGNLYISGKDSLGRILISKLDTSGSVNWSFQYSDTGAYYNPTNLFLAHDTQLVVFGTTMQSSPLYSRGLILFLDTSGQILNQKYIGDKNDTLVELCNAILVNDGFIIYLRITDQLSINGIFTKIDLNGNIMWQKYMGHALFETGIILSNGNFLYSDYYTSSFYLFDSSFNSAIFKAWNLYNFQDFYITLKTIKGRYNNIYNIGYYYNMGVIVPVDSLSQKIAKFIEPPDNNLFVQVLDMKQLSNAHWILLGSYGLGSNAEAQDRFFLMHMNSSLSVINSVILPDTFNCYPYINYNLSISNNDKIYITSAEYTNQLPYLSHIICTDINFSNLCGADPFSFTFSGDSLIQIASDTISLLNCATLNSTATYQRFPLNYSIYDCTPTSSISEAFTNHEIMVYPNPVTDYFYLSKSVNSVDLYDCKGVLRKHLKGLTTKVSVKDLEAGIYFLKIEDDKGVYQKRFLKAE